MVYSIDYLPLEIWCTICRWLSRHDLLQLRLCNDRLRNIISDDQIWKPIIMEKWSYLMQTDVLTDWPKHTDSCLFHVFQAKNRFDCQLYRTLQRLNSIMDFEEYNTLYIQLLSTSDHPSMLPLLHRLAVQSTTDNLPLITLANRLLISIRHKHIYDLILQKNTDTVVKCTEEQFFLKFACMDPAFDTLLHYRNELFRNVNSLILQHYNNSLSIFLELPPIVRADKIITFFKKFINLSISPRSIPIFVEDYMLLRIYAGETRGHTLILLSIIQKLCGIYNVDSLLARNYLIVKDPNFKNGEIYITISSKNKIIILQKKNLVRSLSHITGRTIPYITTTILPTLLKPLTLKELLSITLEEWERYESKWNSVTIKNTENFQRLFPHSHRLMPSHPINFFKSIYKASQMVDQDNASSELQRNFVYSLTFGTIHRLLGIYYPGDYIYLDNYSVDLATTNCSESCNFPTSHLTWLNLRSNITIKDSSDLGKFVRRERNKQLLCIVGYTATEDNILYNAMNSWGEILILGPRQLAYFEWNEEEVQKFLEIACACTDLGLVFSKMNWEAHILQPCPKILQELASGT